MPLAAGLWGMGEAVHALLLGVICRIGLLPGLWYWRDLDEELHLRAPSTRLHAATRVWRLLASTLLLIEAGLLLRDRKSVV